MIPGQHEIWEGSPNRHLGALRDTILIMLPGARLLPVALHREPLDGTVVETVLNHGHGALNIDGCRITASGPSPSIERRKNGIRTSSRSAAAAQADGCIEYRGSLEVYMQDHPGEHLGRWPTNVLLVHGPGCKCVGKKKVRPSNGSGVARREKEHETSAFALFNGGFRPDALLPDAGYVENGTETVEAWDCQSDCPVRLLDEQSGVCKTTWVASGHQNNRSGDFLGVMGHPGNQGYNDTGTASRFFPQFESLDEAMAWISRLIGKPSDATLATRRSTVP